MILKQIRYKLSKCVKIWLSARQNCKDGSVLVKEDSQNILRVFSKRLPVSTNVFLTKEKGMSHLLYNRNVLKISALEICAQLEACVCCHLLRWNLKQITAVFNTFWISGVAGTNCHVLCNSKNVLVFTRKPTGKRRESF